MLRLTCRGSINTLCLSQHFVSIFCRMLLQLSITWWVSSVMSSVSDKDTRKKKLPLQKGCLPQEEKNWLIQKEIISLKITLPPWTKKTFFKIILPQNNKNKYLKKHFLETRSFSTKSSDKNYSDKNLPKRNPFGRNVPWKKKRNISTRNKSLKKTSICSLWKTFLLKILRTKILLLFFLTVSLIHFHSNFLTKYLKQIWIIFSKT